MREVISLVNLQWISSWSDILQIIIVGTVAYFVLVIFLRVSGNRTLSKMNSFDFVVTVALGSVLASTVLQTNVPLLNGVTAMALLITLQFVITWLSVRSKTFSSLIKSEPKLLVKDGKLLPIAMKSARVTEDEVYSAIRKNGLASLDQVRTVILESNGELQAVGAASKVPDVSFS